MCAISVIENEVTFLQAMVKKMPQGDEREFFEAKMESLQFNKGTLETNVQTGVMTPDKYLVSIKKYLKQVQSLLKEATKDLGSSNEHTRRL